MNAPLHTSNPARVPDWYVEHMRPACEFVASLDPFPFCQPSDLSGYIALHQNDYLRLGNHPAVSAARAGANAQLRDESFMSSIFGGSADECEAFRAQMARCMRADDAILTTSGWAANVGLLEAITPLFKPVYIDRHAHASLYDGIKLSLGKKIVIEHNDTDDLLRRLEKNGPGIVVIDAVYSTDGSIGDIRRYLEICEAHECLLVLDEAHSFGMFGNGGGLAVELGLAERVHFRTVSLNKALGGHGGLIAGNAQAMQLVRAGCRSVIFSSATSSVSAAGHLAALNIIMHQPERARRCLDNASEFRRQLQEAGVAVGDSQCQIVSLFFDDEQQACVFYGKLQQRGVLTSVFLQPAIPAGMGVVRYSIHSQLSAAELDKAVAATLQTLMEMDLLDAPQASAQQREG
ncbi:aminotransferase class I/II-fold pyridoxal phosphate-dependent enzyme [Pseudomonas sp. NPDC087612]|uniref:aminotransferase class I/II-fold pyridoxal phosphate-dependent enzyme n=1 Tax=unclassified Pseudomonas TaxID=196821 RepID=UPI0006982A04|nr:MULTISPECIES: aminotransferase class I/II-fold pyridoxal phosphate-dependent enzyme [unclassified Pseudomonas]QPG62221.1 aminotransferase class I/II-fold pyridoxal phosphate-dependent enzyme [Pseudomonas sp. BIGb0427]QVM99032.1 aminotransferase class I/II-fold pyridoxal phosphate-dependent enzyme [Pseudomonas sp. SORT22]UVL54097.1 aminotransferase class I/II-fold pyridoxal phosphate-dependent enzyme [Pseudomonas sp. B21-035]UVM53641.1 aminotransferase class I/II-fold pyridoxal phosphate-depe